MDRPPPPATICRRGGSHCLIGHDRTIATLAIAEYVQVEYMCAPQPCRGGSGGGIALTCRLYLRSPLAQLPTATPVRSSAAAGALPELSASKAELMEGQHRECPEMLPWQGEGGGVTRAPVGGELQTPDSGGR